MLDQCRRSQPQQSRMLSKRLWRDCQPQSSQSMLHRGRSSIIRILQTDKNQQHPLQSHRCKPLQRQLWRKTKNYSPHSSTSTQLCHTHLEWKPTSSSNTAMAQLWLHQRVRSMECCTKNGLPQSNLRHRCTSEQLPHASTSIALPQRRTHLQRRKRTGGHRTQISRTNGLLHQALLGQCAKLLPNGHSPLSPSHNA